MGYAWSSCRAATLLSRCRRQGLQSMPQLLVTLWRELVEEANLWSLAVLVQTHNGPLARTRHQSGHFTLFHLSHPNHHGDSQTLAQGWHEVGKTDKLGTRTPWLSPLGTLNKGAMG